MKKFTSRILSLVLALAVTVMAVPVTMAADGSVVDQGYEFYELVYSPSLNMYVAAAKDYSSANHSVQLYASADALSWKPVYKGNSRSYANPKTRQQLVWIENPGLFAAIFADGTYTSTDGLTWTKNANLSWSSAGNIATNGEQIAVAANNKFRAWDNASAAPGAVLEVLGASSNYYADNVAISPKEENGNMQYVVLDGAGWNTYSHNIIGTKTENGYTYEKTGQGIYNYGEGLYNTIYNPVTKTWIAVNGKEKLFVIYNAGKRDVVQIPGVSAISAAAANNSYIVAGTADGKLFYTENVAGGLTEDSVWTEIPCTSSTANTEEITAITFGTNGGFTLLTKTQIYTGTISGYASINEYKNLSQPVIIGANPFAGVTLIDGTYSAALGKYVVYGNEGETKVAFVSENGKDWSKNIISDKNGAFNTNTKKGIVWWDAQQKFVIGDSSNAWVSEDGVAWDYIEKIGLNVNASDMAVVGNTLYASNGVKTVYKFTELNLENRTAVETGVDGDLYFYYMALSDDADPAIFMTDGRTWGYSGAVKAAGSDKWKKIDSVGNYAAPLDVVYSKALKKFVVVLNSKWRTSIVGTDGSNGSDGPKVADGEVFFSSLETNDTMMLFGGKDGKLYAAADDASLSNATIAQPVPLAADGLGENTMPVTNLFLGKGGEFCAIASDGIDSDILFADQNAKNYWKASDMAAAPEMLTAGETIVVKVQSVNNTAESTAFTMITGIYDGGKLIQVAADDMEMTASSNNYLTQEITLNEDVPETAKMKIYLWNSLEGMQPVAESTGFFQ